MSTPIPSGTENVGNQLQLKADTGELYVNYGSKGTEKLVTNPELSNYTKLQDGLQSIGGLTIAGNDITVVAPVKWRINSIDYSKLTNTIISINPATASFNRIDLIYATTAGTILKIQGTETSGIAVEPTLPANSVRVAPVYITGSTIIPPAPDLSNYATVNYVNALDSRSVKLNPANVQAGNINVSGGITTNGTNTFFGQTTNTGRFDAPNQQNSISGVFFDANYSTNGLDLRAVDDPVNDWYGLRFNGTDNSFKVGRFPFNTNVFSVTDGTLNIQKIPATDINPTYILSRDAVSGEIKKTDGTFLKSDFRVSIGGQSINVGRDNFDTEFGQEYLSYFHKKLLERANAGTQAKVLWSGDSTTSGDYITDPNFFIYNLFRNLCLKKSVSNVISLNRGHSGENTTNWLTYISSDLAQNPDLYIWRWGINDGFNSTLAQFESNLRNGLTTIRASKSQAQLSIILMSPNTVSDSPNNRDEKWFEAINKIIRKAARDFQCGYIDTYSLWLDGRNGASGLFMDNPYGDGRAVHPLNVMNSWIGSKVFDFVFPTALLDKVSTGGVANYSSADRIPISTDSFETYPFGVSLFRTMTTGGWPVDGTLTNIKNSDGTATQTIQSRFNNEIWYRSLKYIPVLPGNPELPPVWGAFVKLSSSEDAETLNSVTTRNSVTTNSITAGGVTSQGSASGYIFDDRSDLSKKWVTYADGNQMRIFNNITSTDVFKITNSGDVGIGVVTPSVKLDVNGAINSTGNAIFGAITASQNSATDNRLELATSPTVSQIQAANFANTVGKDLVLNPASTGNVGIGKTNPLSRLDVNGSARASANDGNANTLVRNSDLSNYVNLTTNQTVDGQKNFTSFVQMPQLWLTGIGPGRTNIIDTQNLGGRDLLVWNQSVSSSGGTASGSIKLRMPADGSTRIFDYPNATAGTFALTSDLVTPYIEITSTSQTAVTGTKYKANNVARVFITLPTDNNSVLGSQVLVRGYGTGGWRIVQPEASTVIHGSSDTTVGTAGYIESQARYDCITLEKIASNEWIIINTRGTLTVN